MASKKSSAVPNNPITGVLAPRASRYLGRNFFHNSSPNPSRNTAPDATATLRSRLRKSRSQATLFVDRVCSFLSVKELPSRFGQSVRSQRVKVTAHLIDVRKGEFAGVSTVGKQKVDTLAWRVDPTTGSG